MGNRHHFICVYVLLLALLCFSQEVSGWHDETHLAVARAAGYHKWHNAAGADMAKVKAGSIESNNHFFNNPRNIKITPAVLFQQAARYNKPDRSEGHLYGAIIASLRDYRSASRRGKYAEYHLAFCAHYIADLSQPLHNIPYDDFNKKHHAASEGNANKNILENVQKLRNHMYNISLRPDRFEDDLAREIARIANLSGTLGRSLKKENRDMTTKEAYVQLGHSASLFRAVLESLGKLQSDN